MGAFHFNVCPTVIHLGPPKKNIRLTHTPTTECAKSSEASSLGVKLADWFPTTLAWLLHQAAFTWQVGVLRTAVTVSTQHYSMM